MYLWIIIVVIVLMILKFLWNVYTHPCHVLARQGANMNWFLSGRIKDEYGNRNTCLKREELEVCISINDNRIHLINHIISRSFKDFIEIEQWLTNNKNETNHKSEPIVNCFKELDMIEEKIDSFSLSFPLIKDRLIELLKDDKKTSYSITQDGHSCRSLVFLLITNLIQECLTTGEFHIYRGTLSGQGHDLLKIWDYSTGQLAHLSHYSKKDANEDKQWIREQIKIAG